MPWFLRYAKEFEDDCTGEPSVGSYEWCFRKQEEKASGN